MKTENIKNQILENARNRFEEKSEEWKQNEIILAVKSYVKSYMKEELIKIIKHIDDVLLQFEDFKDYDKVSTFRVSFEDRVELLGCFESRIEIDRPAHPELKKFNEKKRIQNILNNEENSS